MPAITVNKLKDAISKAYEEGFHGALDLKDTAVEEILAALMNDNSPEQNQNSDFRIYKVKELRSLPIGTMFEHSTMGNGWINHNGNNTYMEFTSGPYDFVNDGDPWTKPMRLIGQMGNPPAIKKKG